VAGFRGDAEGVGDLETRQRGDDQRLRTGALAQIVRGGDGVDVLGDLGDQWIDEDAYEPKLVLQGDARRHRLTVDHVSAALKDAAGNARGQSGVRLDGGDAGVDLFPEVFDSMARPPLENASAGW
jgi:hypothetical protein